MDVAERGTWWSYATEKPTRSVKRDLNVMNVIAAIEAAPMSPTDTAVHPGDIIMLRHKG